VTDRSEACEIKPDGAVDHWLDEVFDGLTGTGAGGRRALTEIEDHLRAAVADAMDRGLTVAEAEREAVTRFGHPDKVARAIRAVHRSLLRPTLTGGWFLAGGAILALGLSTGLTALLDATPPNTCYTVTTTGEQHPCDGPLALGIGGLALVGVGVLALVGLGLARRFTGMRARNWLPRPRVTAASAVLILLAGVLVWSNPMNMFGIPEISYTSWPLRLASGAAAAVAAVVAMAAAARLGRLTPRHGRHESWVATAAGRRADGVAG
jgi:hypothetical protein